MKLFGAILIGLVCLSSLKAQVTLEHTYDGVPGQELCLAVIDSGIYKYMMVNDWNNEFTLYNLDHSVYVTVAVPTGLPSYNIMYVTRSLFDCDTSNLEYLITYGLNPQSGAPSGTSVYRTDGTQLFNVDSFVALSAFGSPTILTVPIVTTPSGTKLTLSRGWSYKVYSLCGVLPVNSNTTDIIDPSNNTRSPLVAYPNPATDNITIGYKLPDGVTSAELVVYNLDGVKVKQYRVDNTFNTILLRNDGLPAGTYTYAIQSSSASFPAGKFVIVQ